MELMVTVAVPDTLALTAWDEMEKAMRQRDKP